MRDVRRRPRLLVRRQAGEAADVFGDRGDLAIGERGDGDKLVQELRTWVTKEIGSFAKPEQIRFVDALPKTRSGKIMRRLLRDIAAGKESTGDTTTLEDYSVLARLREEDE